MGLTRRGVLAGLMAGAGMAALPGGVRAAGQTAGLADLVAQARLGGAVSLAVADAQSGALLESLDPDVALPPASVMKAITAAWAMERLGPGFRFGTELRATGPLAGGIIQGDLVLVGGGDPTLDTDMLGDLAAELARAGVRGVSGRYLVWGGALPQIDRIDDEQPEFVGYNPGISGLNLNYNRVFLEWKRAGQDWALTMDARAERFVPPVRMARARVAQRALPVFSYERRAGQELWSVSAEALGKGGGRWLPVRQPALYAAEVFQTLAAAQGITLPDALPVKTLPEGRVLAGHGSDPLPDLLRDMLKHSTNLTAEAVGLRTSGAGSLRASAGAMADWAAARHGVKGRLLDHSGLGGGSRVSAAALVRLLVAESGGALPGLLKDYAPRDAEGAVVKNSAARVLVKTGTLNFVSSLAGYILPPGGRPLAFAILTADTDRRARLAEADRESPKGGSGWLKRSRGLQARLVGRWGAAG